LGKLYIILEKF